MTKRIDVTEYAQTMLGFDKIMILLHSHPDGDTLGTGIALLGALCALGKDAVAVCTDELISSRLAGRAPPLMSAESCDASVSLNPPCLVISHVLELIFS